MRLFTRSEYMHCASSKLVDILSSNSQANYICVFTGNLLMYQAPRTGNKTLPLVSPPQRILNIDTLALYSRELQYTRHEYDVPRRLSLLPRHGTLCRDDCLEVYK